MSRRIAQVWRTYGGRRKCAALQVSNMAGKVFPPSIAPNFFHSLGAPLTSARVAALFVASGWYERSLEASALGARSRVIPTRWTRKGCSALMELPRVRSELLRIQAMCSWKPSVTSCCKKEDRQGVCHGFLCIGTLRRTREALTRRVLRGEMTSKTVLAVYTGLSLAIAVLEVSHPFHSLEILVHLHTRIF